MVQKDKGGHFSNQGESGIIQQKRFFDIRSSPTEIDDLQSMQIVSYVHEGFLFSSVDLSVYTHWVQWVLDSALWLSIHDEISLSNILILIFVFLWIHFQDDSFFTPLLKPRLLWTMSSQFSASSKSGKVYRPLNITSHGTALPNHP